MKITINITEDPGSEFYTVVAPIVGTCQLSIGQRVEKARVENWCTLKNVTVRIVGNTEDNSPEQLELGMDPIARAAIADKPKAARKQKPAPVKAGEAKALPLVIAK
jgi:hypothetical protein